MEMWADYEMNGARFDAGEEPEDQRARWEQLGREADSFGLWDPGAAARRLGFGDENLDIAEDEEEDFLAEIMRKAGLDAPEPEEIQDDGENGKSSESDSQWFPYPSRMLFLLDTLDNLARLRISSSLMRVFLWILKEAHCKDVPSFDRLRQVQKKIRSQCGIPSIPCKSVQGNVFFMNDPRAIVAKDWSNPTTRKFIHVYPEIPEDGIIREIWHAQKWRKSMDLDILSPMYDAGASHYYVNEVARLKNGNFVIPIHAFSISFDDQKATVINDKTSLICAADLQDNYYDLEHTGKIPKWSELSIEAGHPDRMPNPKRVIANGDPLYCSFVDYFGDDVSGNRSKSWNKHWNAYLTHRNLPRSLLQQEFHMHFISTSPNASISEQFIEFKAAVEETHNNPVRVQDETGMTTCFCIHVNAGPSDNPMQSEISAHIGGKGNHFCRKCEVGGTQKEKEMNNGYHALFEKKILQELEKQVQLACTGVAKHVKDLQTDTGIKDVYTQYWIDDLIARFKGFKKEDPNRSDQEIKEELIEWTVENRDKIYSGFLTMKGFDPTKDTPVELLHTILLGIIKYIWHVSHTAWSPEKKQTYARRLQSTETDGLSIHAIRANYIMQYAGSLIGRQFKTIAQTNVFHVRGLVTDDQFTAWKAAGELSALLWFTEIRNLAEYRLDLQVAVANVLDAFATIDPSKMVTKIKYHLLPHIEEDVVEFGPLIGMITEIYECFNGVFRFCSILSNHLAPSRDIAIQLGDQEGLKHRLTGGWWDCGADINWKRAGPGVRHFMADHPILQKLLGWSESKALIHGDFKLVALPRGKKERTQLTFQETGARRALNFGDYPADSLWKKCKHVASESLDECFVGSWAFAQSATDDSEHSAVISGRITEILCAVSDLSVVVLLEVFQVLSSRDPVYGMPVLVRRNSETTLMIIPSKNLKFKFNVQHDCYTAKCEATGVRPRIQERVESDKSEIFIVHKALDRFIINSHAFHNAHLLRATLPRDLLAPIPLFADRRAKHDELAAELRNREFAQKPLEPRGGFLAWLLRKHANKRATKASRKRKRADEESDQDDETAEGRKPRRKRTKKRGPKPPNLPSQAGSMVANRAKRTITRTERARAAQDEDTDSRGGSDEEDCQSVWSEGSSD
ncbi:hypothetical protein C8J57DRAFT_1564739 [Mycena rebaudengoi]|nr:hypothetical protein C8J57DRAFT_1564739 [Mycena rebaudengoi]